jgi:carbamoyltransferase
MTLTAGFGGVSNHACAALSSAEAVLGVCEQERITRVRGAGVNASGLPDQALDSILDQIHCRRADIVRSGVAEDAHHASPWPTTRFDHHEAHACASYLTSPFGSATIVICDHEPPGVSVWTGEGAEVRRVDWPWHGLSFSDLYSACSKLVGFGSESGEQRFEALARMMASRPDVRLPKLFSTDGTRIESHGNWQEHVSRLTGGSASDSMTKARIAATLQEQIGAVLVETLRRIRSRTSSAALCLGGSLFYHSSINSVVRQSGLFERVFVPANPGNAGLAVGTAMRLARLSPARLSAFMGPSYDPDVIKSTLDNCKLRYDWVDEGSAIEQAVHHLLHGRLVGWFEGRMEWGPRALGARSILADPFSPYVLENLNRFLKRREAWRGYALSALADAAPEHFSGPDDSPFMECDYRPKDVTRFRSVMPSDAAHLRLQVVGNDVPERFRSVLSLFGTATGVPCLVNTSFNGFHEPIVCTPRDAVRVFYGSGLDVLILDRFVLMK